MKEITFFWYLFIIISFIGFYLAWLYGRNTTKFRWSEYIAIIILPIIFIIFLIKHFGINIIYMFLASSAVGFIAEGLIGLVYDKVLNKKLWEYSRLSIKGYTSVLSIPLWGIGGIVFWFLGKLVGL